MIVAGVPCFNEETHIAGVIIQLKKYVSKILVCDDGSTDMTAEVARQLGADVIVHEKNLGYGAALSSIFSESRKLGADILVTIDGDSQHNPADIPRLLAPIFSGRADIVIGSRPMDNNTNVPKLRMSGIKAISSLSGMVAYAGVKDSQSGFRAYNKKAIRNVSPSELGMGASTEILARAKDSDLKIEEVEVEIRYGKDTSTYNSVYHAADVVLSTVKHLSIRHPLMFYGLPGLSSLTIAAVFFSWTLTAYAEQHRIITNIALVSVASAIIGLIFVAVAVILWVMTSLVRELKE
ncbi:MAG: glycosyltransferase family 2 protein [Nitrososphaerota archaeon]|nr:glycosyltransferase family 2 protein [Nitrososphaerota archaeon]